MFGHRSPVPPDPALLARVGNDDVEVDLGTYPEAAMAAVGVNPTHGSPDKPPGDKASPFSQLDGPARDAAMQAALDQLIAEEMVQLPANAHLHQVIDDGLHGRLKLSEPLATLHELAYWCHCRRLRFMMGVSIGVAHWADGQPGEIRVLDDETCFGIPGHIDHVLVKRIDRQTGTAAYALRTVRREFVRVEDLLFSDVATPQESLVAKLQLLFVSKPALSVARQMLTEQLVINRDHGKDYAVGSFEITGVSVAGKQQRKPELVPLARGQLADTLTKNFAAVAAKVK